MGPVDQMPYSVDSVYSRSGLAGKFQAISADYFNITDAEAWPVAGLLVLLDSGEKPVRAELHLYDDLASHIEEAAVRQARSVIRERYHGLDPIPLRILQTTQLREAMDVRLQEGTAPVPKERQLPWRAAALTSAAVVLFLFFGWAMLSWLGGRDGESAAGVPPTSEETAVAVADDGSSEIAPEMSEGSGQVTVENLEGGLPPSQFARPDINIGMRVQILPGLQLSLRSEAGAEAGEVRGFMGDGQEATVIGGPVMTQGDSDTIVWWFVRLDDGTEAWAAANTSQQTLLIPVQTP